MRLPYLVASANWVLGELASCLPEEVCADVYSSLVKALSMPDKEEMSFYPVRVSSAGAIAKLLENDYLPPEWLPLLQAVVGGIGQDDEENSIFFQLLSSMVEAGNENVAVHIPHIVLSLVGAISKSIPPNLEPWPQVVERGFAALSVMAQSWENFILEKIELDASCELLTSDQATIMMTLVKVVERIMALGKPRDYFLWKCFGSLMEASIRLKEVRGEKEEESDNNEEEDNDCDEIEDDEDPDADELEETEEEFLDRYAKAAIDLENSTLIEEGDVEDQDRDIELGCFEEVDEERILHSLMEKYRPILSQGQGWPLELLMRFLNAYPDYTTFFQLPG